MFGLLTDGSFLLGALWVGGVGRFLSWHCIWTINSLSHWEGIREFSRASSAVYVAVVNFVQNGEVGQGQRDSNGTAAGQRGGAVDGGQMDRGQAQRMGCKGGAAQYGALHAGGGVASLELSRRQMPAADRQSARRQLS